MIGPDWLRAPDKDGRRRIDDPSDWVHREVQIALERGIAVPVLVHGAAMPSAQALPEPIKALAEANALTLRDDVLEHDLRRLIPELCERFELQLIKPDITWPEPDKNARVLSEEELSAWIADRNSVATGPRGRNSQWSLVPWLKDADADDGVALFRSYRFRSFEDAVHFMATAARFIARTEHHPAWGNVWRTVTVRLTTFDIGHQPSVWDLRLAEYLDKLYSEYTPSIELPGQPSGPRDPSQSDVAKR